MTLTAADIHATDIPFGGRADSVSPLGRGVETETIELPFRTAAAVARATPERPNWIVPGLVAVGVVTELDGKLKASGKTTFLGQMAKGIVDRPAFLGLPTVKTSVAWLTEERQATFSETLKRAGLADSERIHVLHWHEVKQHPWPVVMRSAVAFARSKGAQVLYVDTIGQWGGLRGDLENSNGAQLDAVEPLQDAAAQGLAIVVSRHERKGGGEVGESGRGGSAFSGAVDIVLSLRRGEGKTRPGVRVLHALSRFSETPESLVIELTEDGYIAHGEQGAVAVLEASQALLDRVPSGEADALDLETLRAIDPALTRSSALKAMKGLCDSGAVQRRGSGKRGDPHRFFLAMKAVSTHTPSVEQQQKRSDSDDAWIVESPHP